MNEISNILGACAFQLSKAGPDDLLSQNEGKSPNSEPFSPSPYAANFRPIRSAIGSDPSHYIEVLLAKRPK